MKDFGKFKKKKRKKIESFKLDMRASAAAAGVDLGPTPRVHISTTSLITRSNSCWQCHVLPAAMSLGKDRVSNWRASSSSRRASHSFTPGTCGSDSKRMVLFSKLAVRRSLKTPARRLPDVTIARRTCASKNIGKETPQVKSMSNALGKTGRCLVGVVLFAHLNFPVFAGTLPSRQRPGPRLPNRDV